MNSEIPPAKESQNHLHSPDRQLQETAAELLFFLYSLLNYFFSVELFFRFIPLTEPAQYFTEAESLANTEAANTLIEAHTALTDSGTPYRTFTETERKPGATDIDIEDAGNNRYSVIQRSRAIV